MRRVSSRPHNTPVSGKAYTIAVATRLNSPSSLAAPTLSGTNGWNVTWTERSTIIDDNNEVRITLFDGVADSGVAGTITAVGARRRRRTWTVR